MKVYFIFKQLEKAEEWARKRCIPFPNLKLDTIKEKCKGGNYEEVYVFKEDDSPIIVHFVMINKSFRKLGKWYNFFSYLFLTIVVYFGIELDFKIIPFILLINAGWLICDKILLRFDFKSV